MNTVVPTIILLVKKLLMLIFPLCLEKLRQILNQLNLKFRITKYKNIFSKGYTKNWSKEIFVIDFVLKNNP